MSDGEESEYDSEDEHRKKFLFNFERDMALIQFVLEVDPYQYKIKSKKNGEAWMAVVSKVSILVSEYCFILTS